MQEDSDPLPSMDFKLYSPTDAVEWDDAIGAAAALLADLVGQKVAGSVLDQNHDGHLFYHTNEVCFTEEQRWARNSAVDIAATDCRKLEIEISKHTAVRRRKGGGYWVEARIHLRKDQLIDSEAYPLSERGREYHQE
jgi:hypothetical protein